LDWLLCRGNVGAVRGGLTNTYTAPGGAAPPGYLPADVPAISAGASNAFRDTQLTYGLQVGYNHQINNVVLGVEASFSRLGLKRAISNTFPTPTAGTEVSNASLDLPWLLTVRPRLGMSIDRTLLYVTGGLAVARASLNQTVVFAPASVQSGFDSVALSNTKVGWTVGGGGEYRINQNWSARAEYLYARFDGNSTTTFTKSPFFGDPTQVPYGHRLDISGIQIARVGLNYLFNSPPVVARY
jgi:outer membrane immunogenic protein